MARKHAGGSTIADPPSVPSPSVEPKPRTLHPRRAAGFEGAGVAAETPPESSLEAFSLASEAVPPEIPAMNPEVAALPTNLAPAPDSDLDAARAIKYSGRYVATPSQRPLFPGSPINVSSERLHLDVDGITPLNVASGTLHFGLSSRVHWMASLRATEDNTFVGTITYKRGSTGHLPYTQVEIRRRPSSSARMIEATFSGPSLASRTCIYKRVLTTYRSVSFEFDRVPSVSPVLSINTGAHPNRPAELAVGPLSIQEVFRRAGFAVLTDTPSIVPVSGAGADGVWSDSEMHDAMEVNWSRFQNSAQWSMWVFYAALHEDGETLGGVMFDSIGRNHRQGTAIFCNSFIRQAPAGDPAPQAWRDRMQFWTAVHEMGHGFNLAHSWQKSLGDGWIPLANEPLARSFMNYPYRVPGGERAFFRDFAYRFSDAELLFMRHAPEEFVRMGDAAWFDNHALEQGDDEPDAAPPLTLQLRTQRPGDRFEFLEPVMVELKLTNASDQPQVVGAHALQDLSHVALVVKKDGRPAKRFQPFATYCHKPNMVALAPGQSLYELIFAGADRTGWLASEPGNYTLQAILPISEGRVISNELRIRIERPASWEADNLGQDYFSLDVGRVLAFDGSSVLQSATDTLREVVEHDATADLKAATHARIALGFERTGNRRVFKPTDGVPQVSLTKGDPDEALRLLDQAIRRGGQSAAETLGNIDFNYYARKFVKWLRTENAGAEAKAVVDAAASTLRARNVIPQVIEQLEASLSANVDVTPRQIPAMRAPGFAVPATPPITNSSVSVTDAKSRPANPPREKLPSRPASLKPGAPPANGKGDAKPPKRK
ncbi:MAG: hypothetical protein SFZ23_13715 [Planctomycetota bacterium]|nr:hypothetical protein [Planctomycetota bacterium]